MIYFLYRSCILTKPSILISVNGNERNLNERLAHEGIEMQHVQYCVRSIKRSLKEREKKFSRTNTNSDIKLFSFFSLWRKLIPLFEASFFLHLFSCMKFCFIHQKSSIWTRKSEAKKQLTANCWASQLDFSLVVACVVWIVTLNKKSLIKKKE